MEQESLHDVLRFSYGLKDMRITRLAGGAINDVWRVDAPGESFVFKRYTGTPMNPARLEMVRRAEDAVRNHGIPVPAVLQTLSGEVHVLIDDAYGVLSRFVEGRSLRVGEASESVARTMGLTLARLHEALSLLPSGDSWVLPSRDWIEAHLRALLAVGNKLRDADPLDEKACRLLERKLGLLSKLPAEPPYFEPHWTHRDYTARNLLFDDRDEVVAVLDFDEVRYTSRGYEVMRCLDHGFPAWSPEGLAFFESYAAASRIAANDARAFAELFCYVSAFSTWPMRTRYLDDEEYQEHWDEFIRLPEHPWEADPDELAETLAGIVNALR